MAKALEIKRIDLLVHPFYGPVKSPKSRAVYTKQEAKELLKIWKRHIDEVAKDPSRLLLISPTNVQTKGQAKLSKELIAYAEKKMGKRIGFFFHPESKHEFLNSGMQPFKIFGQYTQASGIKIDSKTVKTRAFGEYTNSCVLDFLTELNKSVGLENPLPFRNRQSALMVRKSVGADFKPWRLKNLMKTPQGRSALKKKAKEFTVRRIRNANRVAQKLGWGTDYYEPRSKKKKRVA